MLFYLFDGQLLSPLLALVSLPYLAMVASDLRYCGYRRIDVLGVYGFNLVLLPVNLAGVGRSIMQALVGAKTAFRRTPKVRGRTTPALMFVVTPYALVAFSIFTLVLAYEDKHWVNAAVAGLNAVLAAYAIVAFIGVRRSIVDIWQNIRSWLHKPAPQAVARPATAHGAGRRLGERPALRRLRRAGGRATGRAVADRAARGQARAAMSVVRTSGNAAWPWSIVTSSRSARARCRRSRGRCDGARPESLRRSP